MRRVASAAVLIAGLAATIWLLPFWATACLAAIAAAFAGGELAVISGRIGAAVPVAFVAAAAAILALAFVASAAGGSVLIGLVSDRVLAVVLAFASAALLFLVTEELLTEAHEIEETPLLTAWFFVGFLVLFLIEMVER